MEKTRIPNNLNPISPRHTSVVQQAIIDLADLEINESNLILGKGTYGIIINIGNNQCIKLGINEEGIQMLDGEKVNHQRFYEILEHGKAINRISNSIFIPQLLESEKFCMELIQGQTVKTKQLRKMFKELLKNERAEFLDKICDFQFERLLIEKYGIHEDIILTMTQDGPEALAEIYPNKVIKLEECIKFFGENGVFHTDLHNSNIMLDSNGNIFIIDFGIVEIN